MATNDEIAQALGNMSVLEVIALTKELETKWGVKAEPYIAPVVQSKAVAVAKTEFSVVLSSCPAAAKMNTIKAVRDLLKLGLKESKDLVEAAPKVLAESVDAAEAESMRDILTKAGAVIEVK